MIAKLLCYILAVFLFIIPFLITFVVILSSKQMLLHYKIRNKRLMSIFTITAYIIGFTSLIWIFDDGISLIVTAQEIEISNDDNFFNTSEELLEWFPSHKYEFQFNDIINEQITLAKEENKISKLKYLDNFTMSIVKTYENIENEQSYDLSYLCDDIVALDIVKDKEYTINQLSNKKLLIPYIDGDKEVLFYGQYDKNNNWDGICTFNIYEYNEDVKDNVLETILEAEYDNGNLTSYKKVIRSSTTQGIDIWSIFYGEIVHEDNKENYAKGEVWNYFRVDEYSKEFDLSNAEVEDIIYINDFEENLKKFSFIEGYYCGNISNGYYNDDTGDAYIVKYTEGGFIRTVYVGQFKNGLPDDQSGNAWQIVFDNSNDINRYFYYKGSFKNNKRQGKVTSNDYVTQEEINKIIKGIQFNCELVWYDENNKDKDEDIV